MPTARGSLCQRDSQRKRETASRSDGRPRPRNPRKKRGGSTLETIDADTTLLIGMAPASAQAALQNQRCEYGGDLGALDAATTQFLERLLNRDFRVVVYLDGDQRG